jgi:hypothetical protein
MGDGAVTDECLAHRSTRCEAKNRYGSELNQKGDWCGFAKPEQKHAGKRSTTRSGFYSAAQMQQRHGLLCSKSGKVDRGGEMVTGLRAAL